MDALQSKLLNKKRMRAYREALQMLDQFKKDTDDQVVINGSNIHSVHKNESPTESQQNIMKKTKKIKENSKGEDIKENQPLRVRHIFKHL